MGPDRAFDYVGVDFDTAVHQEAFEGLTPRERVADRLSSFGFSRDLTQLLFPQLEEAGDDDRGRFLTAAGSGAGVLAANLVLDLPQFGHGDDGVCRRLRDPADVQVVKLAPKMSPTARQLDRLVAPGLGPRLCQVAIGRVTVDLQDAAKAGEMPRHALGASAVFKPISNHRRAGSAVGSIIARVSPKPGFRRFP
ncbi:hypothetical protein Brsp07_05481 [Brucella sp. NBRC 14130]